MAMAEPNELLPLTQEERAEIKQMRALLEQRGGFALEILLPLVTLLERAVADIERRELEQIDETIRVIAASHEMTPAVCDVCGQPATNTARDTYKAEAPWSKVFAVSDWRYGCDIHPAVAIQHKTWPPASNTTTL